MSVDRRSLLRLDSPLPPVTSEPMQLTTGGRIGVALWAVVNGLVFLFELMVW